MKVRSITVHQVIGTNPPKTCSFLFNDECQLIIEDREGKHIEHRYHLDGNEYERITRKNGETLISRYEYDEEGDLVGVVELDGDGTLKSKMTYNWIKPERVAEVEIVMYDGTRQTVSRSRWYYGKDGQHRYTRGDGSSLVSEYDEHGRIKCGKAGVDIGNGANTYWAIIDKYNEEGLVVEHTFEDGIKGTMTYEYDEYGNWIRMEGRIEDGPVSFVQERTIEYAPGKWSGPEPVYGANDVCHITRRTEFREG